MLFLPFMILYSRVLQFCFVKNVMLVKFISDVMKRPVWLASTEVNMKWYLWLCFKFFKSHCTKLKFSTRDFFSECDQVFSFLRIWSHLLKQSLVESFIFWAVSPAYLWKLCICLMSYIIKWFLFVSLSSLVQ